MITRTHILGILVILMLFLSTIIKSHIPFILLSAIGLYLGVVPFIADKKELKSALNYSRIDKPIWKSALGFILILVTVYFIPLTGINNVFDNETSNYVFIVYVAVIFESYYQNFTNSIRSYNKGLKMPGRNSPLVPWNEIDEISVSEEKVKIVFEGAVIKLNIDRRDLGEVTEIIDSWRNRSL